MLNVFYHVTAITPQWLEQKAMLYDCKQWLCKYDVYITNHYAVKSNAKFHSLTNAKAPSCCLFKAWIYSFTSFCLSWVSFTNTWLQATPDRHMKGNNCAVKAAWLSASQKSWFGVQLKRFAQRWSVNNWTSNSWPSQTVAGRVFHRSVPVCQCRSSGHWGCTCSCPWCSG